MEIKFIVNNVENALGPGNRLCIWTLGCNKRCPGCESPDSREPDPTKDIDAVAYLKTLDLSKITGVTISGGEPFLQAAELLELVSYLREFTDDIIVYSGYKYEELLIIPEANEIFAKISMLIDGEYVAGLNKGEKLRGSSNQRFIIFNEKYRASYEEYNKLPRELHPKKSGDQTLYVGLMPKEK